MSKFSVGDVVAVKDDPWQKEWTVSYIEANGEWFGIYDAGQEWGTAHEDNLELWTVED